MNSPPAPPTARPLSSALPPPRPLPRPHCQWRSVPWLARFFGRSERLIRMWCRDGTFAHLSVYRDSRGRFWVAMPDEGAITIQ